MEHHLTLHRFRVWGIQGMLKLLDELCYMQAVDESVVYVDRHWHRPTAIRFSNFAECDARRGVFVGEVARMGDECEVEPGKNGITDQVSLRIALDVVSLPHPVEFDGRLADELVDLLPELVMSQANGAVRASDGAAAVDLFVAPGDAVDNARSKVLNLVRSDERAMQQ